MYTNITKPTGTSYTSQNPIGKQQYDQSDITYDDPNIFYDAVNTSQYTNVLKPVGTTSLMPGMTMGLLIPLTRSTTLTSGDKYTRINKPTL